jgi:membrane-bound ClpP family serine protease
MRKYLGWVSLGIMGFTFILFDLMSMSGKVSGYVGTNVLIIGATLALVTALLSKKGKSKTASISALGILVGGFIILILGIMMNGGL